jgi:hypothetical protein
MHRLSALDKVQLDDVPREIEATKANRARAIS